MSEREPEATVERHFNFFIPGEVLLVVEHDAPLSGEALIHAVSQIPLIRENDTLLSAVNNVNPRTAVTTVAQQPPTATEPEPEPSPEPRGCAQILSMLFDRLLNRVPAQAAQTAPQTSRASQAEPNYLSSLFLDVGQNSDTWGNPRIFIERLITPNVEALAGGRGRGDDVAISTIAPNWLLNSAQPILTVGGPGARPVAPNATTIAAAGTTEPWRFRFLSEAGARASESNAVTIGSGRGVDIFVLDTAPTIEQFERAYGGGQPINPVVGELIAPNGNFSLNNDRFEVRYGKGTHIDQDIQKLSSHDKGAAISGHLDYEMRDHGLFASGIAATIAPEAHVVLVEVLGTWGVGSLHTIVDALNCLINAPSKCAMVVNLSLTFDLPTRAYIERRANLPLYAAQYELFKAEWGWFTEWLDTHKSYVEQTLVAVERACKILTQNHNAIVVAASGNDSFGLQPECAPRFPAAFKDVIGVGALDDKQSHAEYSNSADLPEKEGVTTFGGNVVANSGTPGTKIDDHIALSADADSGILGLYIGALPDGSMTQDGWARWAGTSFAAPIVAGYLATALSEGKSRTQAIQMLQDAATEPAGKAQLLRVVQG